MKPDRREGFIGWRWRVIRRAVGENIFQRRLL
jgi:hypothetical protein